MNEREEIKIALSMLMDAVLSLLQKDPHQWSARPCGTCRTISGLIGKPFGCYEYRRRKEDKDEKQ